MYRLSLCSFCRRLPSSFLHPAPLRRAAAIVTLLLLGFVGIAPVLRAASGSILLVTEQSQLEQGMNLGGYLQSLGYTVTVDPGAGNGVSDYTTLDAAKIAYLESFDLVVVHRSITSGNFNSPPEPTQWNTLDVPLLLGSAYLARNNPAPRWDWLNGSQARTQTANLIFADPSHPIVNGLGTDLFVGARDVDYVTAAGAGNGHLVATVAGGTAIAVWEEPGFFLGASGQSHTRRRLFFPLMRYHETDNDPPNVPGVFADYSFNGLQLIANAVAYAMNGTVGPGAPDIVDLAPADGTAAHPAANGVSFRVTSPAPVEPAGISLVLNGTDVSAQLTVGADPNDRAVSYGGLNPDTEYEGLITVSNSLGSRSLAFSFDTFPPDITPPTVQLVFPMPGTLTNLTQITVIFSEAVTGVGSDLLINGVPATLFGGGGTTYIFQFEQPAYGTVDVAWDPSAVITDLSPTPNAFDPQGPGAAWQYELLDRVPPATAVISPFPGATVRGLTQIAVTFSEAVTGVDAADLSVNDAPAVSVSGSFVGPYVFQFTPPLPGQIDVAWANGHGIRDAADPPNAFAGGAWSYTLNPIFEAPNVRLNEILAATLSTNQFRDEDGQLQDWIELHNHGGTMVNLAGWSLTDDPDDPDRWIFPEVTLDPGQFLIVFASGKDRKSTVPGAFLHANFQLSSAGEFLGLYNADLPRAQVSVLNYPEQRNDIAYGYDSSEALRYFDAPTPGAANGGSDIEGVVPPVHFNVERGYFDAPFTLHLSVAEKGAEIRYTTDGTEPTAAIGRIYFGPFEISATTVLRAAAFRSNRLPSRTATHTYLFLEQVLTQPNDPAGFPDTWGTASSGFPTPDVPADYEMDPEIVNSAEYGPLMLPALKSLPSLSVVTSVDAMFGPENGIYSHTTENQSLYRGVAWERACSVEFIPTNGMDGFQVDCGIRIQGNASREPRKIPKHPFRLLFKGAYGPGRLEEAVYPDSPVRSFNTLVLRGDFNNSWLHWDSGQRRRGTRIRDGWVKDTWHAMGQPGSHTRYFHLYINGLYWGIYDFGERIDASFAANYLGGERADYDAIASKPVKAVDGDLSAYNNLVARIRNFNQSVTANYEAVLDILDVENFADYMLLNFYGGNQDWGNDSNWNAVRRRASDGKFKYVAWDGEQLLVDVNQNRVSNTDVPGGLHTSLINSPEYRLTFGDRAHKHLFNGGALTVDRVTARWLERADQVDPAIVAESARWGDYRRDVHSHSSGPYEFYTRNDFWQVEIDRLVNGYFPQRGGIVLNQLRAAGLYPAIDAPGFNQHGGFAPPGFSLTMTGPGTIYYTTDGTDPRVFGTGDVSPVASVYGGPVVLNGSAVVKARSRVGDTWSALNKATFNVVSLSLPVRITEIMYNPVGGDPYEFFELRNIGDFPVNLGGHAMSGVTFTFPNGTVLLPGQILILANGDSPAAFASRYPGVTVFGFYTGSLSNGGERLALVDPQGGTVTSVLYNDAGGWPVDPDGTGPSLEIIDVAGAPGDPANWRASSSPNGSPGSVSPAPPVPQVRLNEIMAENLTAVAQDGLFPDWIELHNAGGAPADLGGWSLSDGGDPRRYVFPAGTSIPAGGYLMVWCDTNVLGSGPHTGFALNREGESVFLYDGAVRRVDAFTFGPQLPDRSVGRLAAAWVLTQPTPGAANAAAALASSSDLRINEWLADSPPGEEDWLELHNANATLPAALQGLYLSANGTTFRIPFPTFVAPSGHVRLWADELEGGDHLDFKLAAAGGVIALSDRDGSEIDRVAYGPQTESITEGRLPDGADSIVAFPGTASPGASNYASTYAGATIHEIMALNGSAVAGPGGEYADWVELHNPNGAPFDLSGMWVSDNPGNPDKWIVPAGVSVPAGGHLVLWCDGSRAASVSAGAPLNTGFSLSGSSGGVYLFNAAGQRVDAVEYGPQILNLTIGESGGIWRLLAAPTPGAANGAPAALGPAAGLRINEWMAEALEGGDWFELHNTGDFPVALGGLSLTDDVSLVGRFKSVIAPLSYVGGRGFVRFEADGSPSRGRQHVAFNLDGQGESIRLYSSDGAALDTVFLGPQTPGVSQGRFPDGADFMVFFDSTASPGQSNHRPIPHAVVNEVLTHTDPPLEDAVELFNPTDSPADIGGWYLSDSLGELKKYRIPAGTVLPARGFRVVYEAQLNGGIGSLVPFTFNSARGESVILAEADEAGDLTGFRSEFAFGASANGVSFGRHRTSRGEAFPSQAARTFGEDDPSTLEQFRAGTGLANAGPRIGPVVINEVMYHPPAGGAGQTEFIELHNVTGQAVSLFDPAHPSHTWRLRGGVTFDVPSGFALPARGYAVVVDFDPQANGAAAAAFRAAHGLPGTVTLLGPWSGSLANEGEAMELLRPDSPQGPGPDEGYVPYVLVDRVAYDDRLPWPEEADGEEASLQRRLPFVYGDDPVHWKGAAPTPGRANVPEAGFVDTDGDGLPDGFEVAEGLNANDAADAAGDNDNDGASNESEFLQGTDLNNGTDVLAAPFLTRHPAGQALSPGQTVELEVVAGGTAPLRYQWHLNGRTLPGANASVLTLQSVGRAEAGVYTVTVWNDAGFALSDAAEVVVNIPPRITAQPVGGFVVRPGTNVFFSVSATGTGMLHYQWRRNGIDLPGATGMTLQLTDVQGRDAGDYTVRVTDDIASTVSEPASLIVLVAPVIVEPAVPVEVVAAQGSAVTFGVTVTNTATLPLYYIWRRGFSSIALQMVPDSHSTFLRLENIQPSGVFLANQIRVTVTNAAFTAPTLADIVTNAFLIVLPDGDGDGMPDEYETANGLNESDPGDALGDRDGDGLTNGEEHLSGTDPNDPADYLKVSELTVAGDVRLEFNAKPNLSYTVEYKEDLSEPVWQRLRDIVPGPGRVIVLHDPGTPGGRYYRLVTPRQPPP